MEPTPWVRRVPNHSITDWLGSVRPKLDSVSLPRALTFFFFFFLQHSVSSKGEKGQNQYVLIEGNIQIFLSNINGLNHKSEDEKSLKE